MKVFYVSSNIASIQYHLVDALEKAGVEAQILAYTMRKASKLPPCPVGSLVFKSRSHAKGPLLYLTRLHIVAAHFKKRIQLSSNAIFHGNMLFCDGIICRKLARWTEKKYVVSVRNTDLNLPFLWQIPWIRKAGINVLKDAASVIFLSDVYKEQLLRRIPKNLRNHVALKSTVIPNGIDDFWHDNKLLSDRTLHFPVKVLTVGRIEKNKNQLSVACAINELRKEKKQEICYEVIGEVKDATIGDALRQYDFVSIKPFMQKEQLINEMRYADIYAMPSHTETFGLVYVEALSQKLPVIYSSNQGFDGQYPNGVVGYAVDSHDVSSIKKAIESIVDRYGEMTLNANNDIDRYRWSLIADALIKNYNIERK